MRFAAVQQFGVRKGFAREIERPDITLGSARNDGTPELVVIVTLPQIHQPGDGLTFEIAGVRGVV